MASIDVLKLAINTATDKKASRILVQDLRGLSDVCEYQLICSADNDRQTKAIAQGIEDACSQELKTKPIAIEGKQSGQWILLDYGNVLVHVFFNPIRDYYALEALWPKPKPIDLKS